MRAQRGSLYAGRLCQLGRVAGRAIDPGRPGNDNDLGLARSDVESYLSGKWEQSVECRVKWTGDGMSFLAETGSNHAIVMDGAAEAGGRNLAPRPMELLLAGAGGCTAFDVVHILKKGRHAVSGCEVSLQAERAETEPIIYLQSLVTESLCFLTVPALALRPRAIHSLTRV